MKNIKRILIIDDECPQEEESIREGFAGTNIEVILCSTREEGSKWIQSKALFDCIVLDWYLEDVESPILSKQILNELQGNYYTPVLIYSAHADNFRAEMDTGAITYPKNLIHEVNKGDFTDIRTKVNDWLNQNYTAKLSSIYLEKVYQNIHKTFWYLNEIPDGNIASVYKHIISENGNIDWANDFIINLLLQSITSDNSFRDSVSAMITQLQNTNPQTTPEQKSKILSKILYYRSNSTFISNGDIFKIQIGESTSYGITVTPDCDLAQGKTKYIEFIKLVENGIIALALSGDEIKKQAHKLDSHFYLPSVQLPEGGMVDLVAILKSKNILVCCNKDAAKYPSVTFRIKYSDTFKIDNMESKITYLCSLVNPYKAEFSQRKSAHDSRVGIPSVYQYIK